MTSSLYRSRPLHLPAPKLYGFQMIDHKTQSQMVERISRPTMSVLQAQIASVWEGARRSREKIVPPKKSSEYPALSLVPSVQTVAPVNPATITKNTKTDPKPFVLKIVLEDILTSKPSARSADTKSTDTRESSSGKLIDSLPISDWHLGDEHLRNLALQWTKQSDTLPVRPPCTCPRGEVLMLEAETDRWNETRECTCNNSTPRSTCTHFQTRDPADWSTVRRIVRRLNDSQTAASAIRRRENSRRKRRVPINSLTAPTQLVTGGSEEQPPNSPVTLSPRIRRSLFDSRGQFKTLVYVNRFQREHQLEQDLNRLSRPTTASSFKQCGRCPICEQSPGERTVFGVRYAGNVSSRSLDQKGERKLVQRLTRPTCSHSTYPACCERVREYIVAPDDDLFPRRARIYLSGEAIVRRIAQSAKVLPLLSGLPRSSSVRSITARLYSGKCRQAGCHNNNNNNVAVE